MLRINIEVTQTRPSDGGLDLKQIGEIQIVNHVDEDGYYHIRGWLNDNKFSGLQVKHEYEDGALVLVEKALEKINTNET